jgi:hypothetical protein
MASPKPGPDPSFAETFRASRDYAADEMLSISHAFNNEAYFDRHKQIREMKSAGFDFDPYTNEKGQLDYDRIANDTGLIKSNGQLRTERNEMLAERRAYAQDVMDRGPGLASFAGMSTSLMFGEPINVATLPVSFGTAAKGLSVMAHAFRGVRNTAGLAVATELAIQPLVYNHKHDINSPYEMSDAIANIATVALTAGALGGTLGGIGGYFTRAAEVAAEEAAAAMRFTSFSPLAPAGTRMRYPPDYTMRIDTRPTYFEAGKVVLEKATEELTELAGKRLSNAQVKAIKAEQRELTERILKLDAPRARGGRTPKADKKIETAKARLIELDGQLDVHDSAKAARADLSRIEQGIIPSRYDQQIKELIANGTSEMAETSRILQRMANSIANERGFVASDLPLSAYQAAKFRGGSPEEIKSQVLKRLEEKDLMDRIKDTPANQLDTFMQALHKQSIDDDVVLLKSMAEKQDQMNKPRYTPGMFKRPEVAKAPKAETTPLERDALNRSGLDDDYDAIMDAYNSLSTKQVYDESGKLVDADDIMKAADEELEGLESIMRCSRG